MFLFPPLHVETSIAQYTPVFLPGENPWQRSLTGHSLQGRKELGTTKVTLCTETQDFFAWGSCALGTVKHECGSAAWLVGTLSAQGVQVHGLPPPQELWNSIQFIQSCLTICDPMDSSKPGSPVYHQLPEVTQSHVHRVNDAIQPSHPLYRLLLPPSIFSSIRDFSNELVLRIKWPKYWRFSFSISPSNEYSGLISLRIGWFDLLAGQGTLKSLLQHHSSKTSILGC